MIDNLKAELYEAAAMTFQEMGFVFLTEELEAEQIKAVFEAGVSLEFLGPFNGGLIVRVYGSMLPNIAANMMGIEGNPTVQFQHDALGEIANVICGNVLPRIGGANEIFHISAPDAAREYEKLLQRFPGEPAAQVTLGFEGGRAEISIYLTDERAA
ncbi:MAG: chemotaxis protein CheX [Candidatus Eisenbacteria bacterium]|uniref:Chemotaxis protein CheX n=1 Tax=Eiseniibacteriota bacterium TaxID=2212470 RepID=A0A948W5A3_UNCEI|nr:chemotaxis protein CheX [Candidatus Eisenbacteria bacterium]MBU1951146.1 chemotaxis protein CheX [Candidatus Eisenbacteria bacterium]MBU2690189.1 chemotaxis protein CheX [Candidatus Eisenbacteria bacterium]